MKKALITGGAGFIGSNLTAHLLGRGWGIIIFDNLSRKGAKKNLDWLQQTWKTSRLKVIVGDVRNYGAVKEVVGKVDVVYHLAAQVAVTTSILAPREDFEVNALGSFNVLEAARESKHKPIVVYSSTNKVYGQMENVKVKVGRLRCSFANTDFKEGISEDFPLDFHSPYGCSNGAADQYTRDYYRIYGIPTVVFRQSCIYGPRQFGVEDQGWVAHFVIAAYFNRPITIYGDGKQVRDLLYIDDLIKAYETAVEKQDKAAGQIYNIGGGSKYSLSLLEYIKFLEDKLRKTVKVKFSKWRPGDQKVYISDNRKLKRQLGWEPKISPEVGIARLLTWIKENEELFE